MDNTLGIPLTSVRPPGLVTFRQFSFRQFSIAYLRAQLLDLPALTGDASPIHATNNLSRSGEDVPPTQKLDALPQGIDMRFLVERQTKRIDFFCDLPQSMFQHRPVRMNQDEIIHVPDIMPDAKPFLDVVIQIVKNRQFNQLACLAPKANTVIPAERINDVGDMLIHPVILHSFADRGLGGVMGRGWKILGNIALQHPALVPMLIEIPPQMYAHALMRERYAFADLARAIVMNEASRDRFVQVIVAQAPLELPVPDAGCHDFTFLGFGNVEYVVRLDFVGAVEQVLPQLPCVFDRVQSVVCNAVLPHHAQTAFSQAFFQAIVRDDFLIGFHEKPRSPERIGPISRRIDPFPAFIRPRRARGRGSLGR